MCRAWTELGNEKFIEARQEGRLEGGNSMVYLMVQDNDVTPEKGAKRLGITVEELKKRMAASGYRFPE